MMQIDTQVATPLKPANVYPQQTDSAVTTIDIEGGGTSHSVFRQRIHHFQWLSLKMIKFGPVLHNPDS